MKDSLYNWNNPKAAYVRSTDISLAVAAVVVLVSEAKYHSQKSLVLSSELPIRCAIYEGVDGTTQISQESVCKVLNNTRNDNFQSFANRPNS